MQMIERLIAGYLDAGQRIAIISGSYNYIQKLPLKGLSDNYLKKIPTCWMPLNGKILF